MKNSHAIGLAVAAIAITVAIEESRIAGMRAAGDGHGMIAGNPAISGDSGDSHGTAAAPGIAAPTKATTRVIPDAGEPEAGSGSFGKTVRKMWDNPAGKAMMNQGVKITTAMLYADFIGGLTLSKDEEDYFKDLLGKSISDQQEIGMRMISATPDERKELAAELEQRRKDNEEAIKAFLNNDEDYQRFSDYQNRLPERQQLDGIRATFASKEAPLDPDTESRLIEAMYRARTETKSLDFTGPDAFTKLAAGDATSMFEQNWDTQEKVLMNDAEGILDESQMEAFKEYRQQVKELQKMSLKMAEQMMPDLNKDQE